MDSLFSLEGYSGKVWSKGIVKRHGIFVCSSDLAILCGKMRALSQISQELRQHVERSRIEILDSQCRCSNGSYSLSERLGDSLEISQKSSKRPS